MRQEVDHVTFFYHMAFLDYVTVIIEFLIKSTYVDRIFFVLKLRNEDVIKIRIYYYVIFISVKVICK